MDKNVKIRYNSVARNLRAEGGNGHDHNPNSNLAKSFVQHPCVAGDVVLGILFGCVSNATFREVTYATAESVDTLARAAMD